MEEKNLSQIVEPLLAWFYENARELPWREPVWKRKCTMSRSEHAYRVWVSEIMLQQTRVEAVKPYYKRFLENLPDLQSLADCNEERLLKLWEGLGYYNRVRNMQKAAQQICADYDQIFPEDFDVLLKLPGIGTYTAGAIASISAGAAVPAVDGNVLRVVSRICGIEKNIALQTVKKEFELLIRKIIPKDVPGDFNQALMELGAVICVPNGAPDCEACPLKELCTARQEGLQEKLPIKEIKKSRKIEKRTVFIIQDQEHVILHKRPSKGLLAGLYELPNILGNVSADEAVQIVKEMGFSPIRIKPIISAKHIFSHVEWHMEAYQLLVENKEPEKAEEWILAGTEEISEKYPIPSAFSAYSEYLSVRLGKEVFE